VSPYDATGGLLPLVTDGSAAPLGAGDAAVQAYNFRLCVTRNASNKLPWPKPAAYDAAQWALLRRYAALAPPVLSSFLDNIAPLPPTDKFDLNNGGLLSTDCAGCSWGWPAANASERARLWALHRDYQQGLLWTLSNDEAVPAAVRAEVRAFGLCADEFVASGGWPEQLYVREGRRLVGDAVFTQRDVQARADLGLASIGLGSYAFDGHFSHRGPCLPAPGNASCAMWTGKSPPPPGTDVWLGGEGYAGPNPGQALYQIPAAVLFPRRSDLTNLVSPTAPSASHVAFCSLRMEPQFMIMGHAAGDIAAATARTGGAVQDVDLSALHAQLTREGALLSAADAARALGQRPGAGV
jgi:hypothetical protein